MYAYMGLGRRTRNAKRLIQVLQVLVKHGFADVLRRIGFERSLPGRLLRSLHIVDAPEGPPATFGCRLRTALTELGPTFIKFGQVMSTRPDIVSIEVAEELSKLQDEVAPLPFDVMAAVIKEALDAPAEELYAQFEREPVAAASLSQVYRARLKTGESVAVKVRRPGVDRLIDADIGLMRQIAAWIDEHVKDLEWFDAPGIVEEFARSVRRELDFKLEAGVIDQFQRNFADYEDVFVPKVYPNLCATEVLTMDWVDGVRVDRFEEYEARNCDRETVAVRGCEILCDMIFEHRLFHADPHPGNIFITQDNKFAFLDYGMAGHLEKSDVAILADLFLAIFKQDSAECVDALLLLTPGEEPEDREALQHAVAEFIAFEAQAIIGGGQVARGLERATEILRQFQLQLASRFALLLKALATIEHVGRKLYPDMDMVPVMQPYIERLVSDRFKPMNVLRELQQNVGAVRRFTQEVPDDFARLVRQLRRGHFRTQLRVDHINELIETQERNGARITLGLVDVGLFLASSVLVAGPNPARHLGYVGLIGAVMLGVGLFLSAWMSHPD